MKKIFFILLICITAAHSQAQPLKTKHFVIVTLDGLRWQEVFRGGDITLMRREGIDPAAWEKLRIETIQERRKRLLPFLWSVVVENGQIYGNRDLGNREQVMNHSRLSYPGYHEIFTGFAPKKIKANRRIYSSYKNILAYLNEQDGFQGKVAVFTSWNVLPFILNSKRFTLPVNSGLSVSNAGVFFSGKVHYAASDFILSQIRPDTLTYCYSKQYLRLTKPRVLYIGFDETDEAAHSGNYDLYLYSAQQADKMIADLWQYLQSDPFYKEKTTLLVTCDHGRGSGRKRWKDHGPHIKRSEETWFAILGPDTPAEGEIKDKGITLYHTQLAQTIAKLLGFDFQPAAGHAIGSEIRSVFGN